MDDWLPAKNAWSAVRCNCITFSLIVLHMWIRVPAWLQRCRTIKINNMYILYIYTVYREIEREIQSHVFDQVKKTPATHHGSWDHVYQLWNAEKRWLQATTDCAMLCVNRAKSQHAVAKHDGWKAVISFPVSMMDRLYGVWRPTTREAVACILTKHSHIISVSTG